MATRIRGFLIVALAFVAPARADFYLVAQVGSPQAALTRKEAVDLYMGHTRTLANGDFALLLDLPRGNERRTAFYQSLTGMGPAQINSYWSRLMFSGRSLPPQALPDEAAMISVIKRNPGAVGWLSHAPTDKQVKTLLVIKEVN